MGDALLAPRTLGALTDEMARRLAPTLGQEAAREARELLAALHDMPRHWPLVERTTVLGDDAWARALAAADKRAHGAPLQYAAGRAAFRQLTLDVDERVLIPRPETELLVDIVLEHSRGTPGGVAVDVGTGSGAIALALASEGAFDQLIATDISMDALAVARANARHCAGLLRAPVALRHGSLLGPVPERALRVVVSNPPYIAFEEAPSLPAGVRNWEPAVALFSGEQGMSATAELVRQAAQALAAGGLLALEVDARRAGVAAELVASAGTYEGVRVLLDLTGRERFVVATRGEERG
ncbi:MAG TPA: peptide chain release factor N(5)-glutamine methyltransferase [Gemmatimonadaceae bacterium]|nr:peptide chain release factor N(5)-glutamine methyltransferase [Gemmatimonadaceae bacterium]